MFDPKEMADNYFKLLEYCQNKENFDDNFFKMIHDQHASKYKKMSVEAQGEYTHFVAGTIAEVSS